MTGTTVARALAHRHVRITGITLMSVSAYRQNSANSVHRATGGAAGAVRCNPAMGAQRRAVIDKGGGRMDEVAPHESEVCWWMC
jgi:hypothetical protein